MEYINPTDRVPKMPGTKGGNRLEAQERRRAELHRHAEQVAEQVRRITKSARNPEFEDLWGDRVVWTGTHYQWSNGRAPSAEETAKRLEDKRLRDAGRAAAKKTKKTEETDA